MKTIKEALAWAEENQVALGHFNFSSLDGLRAIANAAKDLGVPVLVGVSEGEEEFVGLQNAVDTVRNFREELGVPIFLNADHHYSFEKVKEAIDNGYDMVIVDGANLPFEENVALTKKVVEYAKEKGGKTLVEGEIGFIGKSSKIIDAIPEGVSSATMTSPDEAKNFIAETGIDLLAPSVGNIHGMIKGGNPALDIERITSLNEASSVPLVLHGGSGISDEDFRSAIKAGIRVIHINTELRVAYTQAIKLFLAENPDETTPYKILKQGETGMQKVVTERLKLFSLK
ncbi:MAG: class II fructose-bisphosphate aldolase [Candidatus Pacebacteria bacterium]|nr:class II fructose-bisphosphate aldolase [Candidatus Paceibacterota bacterium]MBP9058230.1 class II fructose-bisphosphate aldolase [Candidatus Paceibacterota bacterium]MBP9770204.1 class II fructose-bisphosphate aldolase [Candidatus Paceibacterota bacterium]